MNHFQITILKRCSYGHLSSSKIPELLEWTPESNSSAISLLSSARKKINDKCREFSGDLTPVIAALEEFAEQSKEKVLRKSFYAISRDLKGKYFHENIFQKIKSTQKKKDYLINNLDTRLDRIEKELITIHKERRQKEYIRRSLNSLTSECLLSEHSLPIHLRKKFGDKVYCLTKRGAAYIRENIEIQFLYQPRIIKYYEDKAKHELMVAEIINTLMRKQTMKDLSLAYIIDEAMIKSEAKQEVKKYKHLFDLFVRMEFRGYSANFYIEIDNGSQPISVFEYRAKVFSRLIYVCSTERGAKKLQQNLSQNRGKYKPVLITTYDRFITKGIEDAGYLSANKPDFCRCGTLVAFKVGKQSAVGDESGCPCILSSFVESKTLKTKVLVQPSKTPMHVKVSKPIRLDETPTPRRIHRRPPTFWEMTVWQKIKYLWNLLM